MEVTEYKCGTVQKGEDISTVFDEEPDCTDDVMEPCLNGQRDKCTHRCLQELYILQESQKFFNGIAVTIMLMAADQCMFWLATCSCMHGRSCPTGARKGAEWLGSKMMMIIFLFGVAFWYGAFDRLQDIHNKSCRIEAVKDMVFARCLSWALSMLCCVGVFYFNRHKEIMEHRNYAVKLSEHGLGDADSKQMFNAVATCRQHFLNLQDENDLKVFIDHLNTFKAARMLKGNLSYVNMLDFRAWMSDQV
jgi:hypothetical protein